MANRLPATDARRVSPAFLLYGRCRFKSMCFLLLRGFSALFRLFWLGKFPPSTKPAPLSPGLAAGTGQHRPSRAPWCAFPHPLQNRVPRVQVLLPLPKKSGIASAVPDFFVSVRQDLATRCARRPACGACRGGLQPGGLRPGPTEAAAETSPSAPATKPAKTLGFRRFSFCTCCMGMGFTLVQTLGFPIRFYPFPTVLILSSTQNAPGFALFGRFRVRFSLFPCFSGAKFSALFLCILLHSVYKLKPSVIPCRREVSFLT